ncbi:MAG: ribonuclease P protein component [Janthinobacterium lividum]
MTETKSNLDKIPFPKLRLRRHADYQRAYEATRKQHAREMSFFFARRDRMAARRLHPDESLKQAASGPRIGLTVGKVMGKAHDRNRIKRRLRAALAMHAGELAGLPVDVILHPRRSVLLLEWDKLQREVHTVFRTVRKAFNAPPGPGAPRVTPSSAAQSKPPAQPKAKSEKLGRNSAKQASAIPSAQ